MPRFACLLGIAQSGKSERAARLVADCEGLCVVSARALLRAEAEAGGNNAATIRGCLDAGTLVPASVASHVVAAAIHKKPEGTMVVLVGFPRSAEQVDSMLQTLGAPQFAVWLGDGASAAPADMAATRLDSMSMLQRVDTASRTEDEVAADLQALFISPPLIARERILTGNRGETRDWTLQLLQWNVLADGLSGNCEGKGGFTKCPASWLDWERRRHQILKVVGEHGGADIVTMQEVDHFEEWYQPELDKLGYDGVHRVDAHSPCYKVALGDSPSPDGVAIFYKRDKLELDESFAPEDGEDFKRKLLLMRFRSTDTGNYIVVANAHLDSNKKAPGVATRTAQTQSLLATLEDFALQPEKMPTAVLVAGDFNATRDEPCHALCLQSPLGLRDTYGEVDGLAQKFTSFKVRGGTFKKGVSKYAIDYIFHTGATAVATAVLELPQEQDIGEDDGLPSPNWPSDHLSLWAEFSLPVRGVLQLNPLVDGHMTAAAAATVTAGGGSTGTGPGLHIPIFDAEDAGRGSSGADTSCCGGRKRRKPSL